MTQWCLLALRKTATYSYADPLPPLGNTNPYCVTSTSSYVTWVTACSCKNNYRIQI